MSVYDYCNAAMYISLTTIICSVLLWATGSIIKCILKGIIGLFRRD